jgi:LacI family transcriptional regulator
MADIARKAGTHVTTVSLALRNSQRLSAATRERINELAREMGYTPDPWMRALVSYRDRNRQRRNPPVLAYVTNWNTRWGWKNVTAHPHFFRGAEQKAQELGFILDHFWMREPGLTHGRLSQIFQTRGIVGIIIASHVREIDDSLKFEWENFSAVKIDYFPHKPELFTVTNNHLHIIRLAMRRAMDAGYRRIAFVMDQGWDETVDHHWCAGFFWEQQRLDPADRIEPYLIPGLIWEEQNLDSRGRQSPLLAPHFAGLRNWLLAERPDVIISKDQFVLPVLAELGWQVPRDVAFVDLFQDDETGKIAGVRQNHATVGALAVETVAAQIQHNQRGIPEIPTTSLVEGTWIDGASLPPKPAAAGSRRLARPRNRAPAAPAAG